MASASRLWNVRAAGKLPGIALVSFDQQRKTSKAASLLSMAAAKLLGSGIVFDASKLKVVFMGGGQLMAELEKTAHPSLTPRIYTVTHCDLTANLTLSVSEDVNFNQLRGWYNKLCRDDVVAEWKQQMRGGEREMALHVHCHVSGGHVLLELAAELRYHIFRKELPLVLKAVVYGDGVLFKEHPELMDNLVWVHFHSTSKAFNRVECWGSLRDAAATAAVGASR